MLSSDERAKRIVPFPIAFMAVIVVFILGAGFLPRLWEKLVWTIMGTNALVTLQVYTVEGIFLIMFFNKLFDITEWYFNQLGLTTIHRQTDHDNLTADEPS